MDNDGWMDAAPFKDELPDGWYDEPKPEETVTVGKCPCCGSDVNENERGFFCSNFDCGFALWKNNRFFEAITKEMTRDVAKELLATGQVKLSGCKSVRTGNTFNCIVKMRPDEDNRPKFTIDFPKRKKKED